MRSPALRFLYAAVLALSTALVGLAQQVPAVPAMNDPRVGLKAGLRDAGEATKNMDHIATMPKPDGFFDPAAPAGRASRPSPEDDAPSGRGAPPAPPAFDPVASNRLGFTNSDLAF